MAVQTDGNDARGGLDGARAASSCAGRVAGKAEESGHGPTRCRRECHDMISQNVLDAETPVAQQQAVGAPARHSSPAYHQRTCSVCGKAFTAARPQALYCSPRCKQTVLLRRRHEAGRRRRHRRCPRCGQVFVARRADGVYCSNGCRQAMHRKRTTGGKESFA